MQQLTTTPRNLKKIVIRLMRAGLIPMILSAPGIGKSDTVHSTADELNLEEKDIRLSTHEPQDLNGYPVYDSIAGQANFVPFGSIFPTSKTEIPDGKDGWLLFLDEFTTIDESMQAATYKLLLDRTVGQDKLHDNVLIVLAGNRIGDGAVANELGSAIYSRVVEIHVVPNTDEWLEDVALPNRYDPRIIGYLSHDPIKINDFDPDHSAGKAFACSRTWSALNSYLMVNPHLDELDNIAICGIIGQAAGIPFIQHCKVYKDIVPFDVIIKDPLNAPISKDPALLWSTVAMLQNKLTKNNFEILLQYVKRLDLLQKILFFRGLNATIPELNMHPLYREASLEIMKYIRGE